MLLSSLVSILLLSTGLACDFLRLLRPVSVTGHAGWGPSRTALFGVWGVPGSKPQLGPRNVPLGRGQNGSHAVRASQLVAAGTRRCRGTRHDDRAPNTPQPTSIRLAQRHHHRQHSRLRCRPGALGRTSGPRAAMHEPAVKKRHRVRPRPTGSENARCARHGQISRQVLNGPRKSLGLFICRSLSLREWRRKFRGASAERASHLNATAKHVMRAT